MIPAEIGHTLIIAAIVLAVIWACHRVWRGITQAREPEPDEEAYGDTSCWRGDMHKARRAGDMDTGR